MGKVRFGLSNVHYAKYNADDGTYDTPVAAPGARSFTIEYEGDTSNFYADNIVYETFATSSSITGTLEIAAAENQMLVDLLGYIDDSGLILEDMEAQPVSFALLGEINGNVNKQRFVLYNCKLSRPSQEANTTEDTVEPDTQSFDFTAIGRDMPVLGETKNIAKAMIENTTANKAKFDAFFTQVTMPTAAAGK